MTSQTPHYAQKKTDQWHTPKLYIEAVRSVLGIIDLDTASSNLANLTVKANRIYTAQDNALVKPWTAQTVFCNPPFSLVKQFTQKAIEEYQSWSFKEGIFLCNACTSEKWFQPWYDYPICFTNHRIRFNRPDGTVGEANTKGQAFIYLGDDIPSFYLHFKNIGTITQKLEL